LILEEVQRLAFANMLDYVGTTKDGDAYVNLSELTRDQAAAIQEVTVEEYTEGRGEGKREIKRTKFKLCDKTKNLELLGEYMKLFGKRLEISGKIKHEITEEEKQTAEECLNKVRVFELEDERALLLPAPEEPKPEK
jgi:phage terminase small subunit